MVRKAIVAGMFYEDDFGKLDEQINKWGAGFDAFFIKTESKVIQPIKTLQIEMGKLDPIFEDFTDLLEDPEASYQFQMMMAQNEEAVSSFLAKYGFGLGMMGQATSDFTEEGKKDFAGFAASAGSILSGMAGHNKELAHAAAIISTAAGVTRALEYYPPPLSFIMAALQAAAGAVQIATIEATPIPSADVGAYLPKDTLVQAHRRETILPPDDSPFIKDLKSGMGGMTIHFHSPLIETKGISNSDLQRAGSELFRIIDREARRRGGH